VTKEPKYLACKYDLTPPPASNSFIAFALNKPSSSSSSSSPSTSSSVTSPPLLLLQMRSHDSPLTPFFLPADEENVGLWAGRTCVWQGTLQGTPQETCAFRPGAQSCCRHTGLLDLFCSSLGLFCSLLVLFCSLLALCCSILGLLFSLLGLFFSLNGAHKVVVVMCDVYQAPY
jgi:hypothetical protein